MHIQPPHRQPGRNPWLVALPLLLLLAQCGEDAADHRRPDIVLIVIDTLRADAILDPAGLVATPRIDELANDSAVFSAAFSHAPMTLPSHTALFSSRPPVETGVLNNGQTVPEDLPLLAEWLSNYGYETQAVISLGTLTPLKNMGLNRGFDSYDTNFWQITPAEDVTRRLGPKLQGLEGEALSFLFAHFSDPHEPYNAHGTVTRKADLHLDDQLRWEISTSDVRPINETTHLSQGRHTIRGQADHDFRVATVQVLDQKGKRLPINWISKERGVGKEFSVSFEAPTAGEYRVRIRAQERLGKDEIRRRYALEVEYVDRHVGKLLDELRRTGRYDNSLIILTSDHGEALGERGTIGHVQNLHDEMLHVPLIIKPPAWAGEQLETLRASQASLTPQVNIAPTILEMAAVPPLPGQRGASLLQERRPPLVAQTHKPEAKRNLISIRSEELKLIYDIDSEAFELYDLRNDPMEAVNVFSDSDLVPGEWEDLLRNLGARAIERTRGEATGELEDDLKALGYGE